MGLGLTSVLIGVAHDALEAECGDRVIGLLSVTCVAGVGYPVASVLTRYSGVRFAYGVGRWGALHPDKPRPRGPEPLSRVRGRFYDGRR
jgi:hypothetical protein